jgi:hypothetical protein
MKKILLIILLAFPFVLFAQTLNQKAFDEKRNNEMLVGYCNREGFKMIQSNFDSVYQAEYSMYKPDQATLDQIAGKLKKIKIKVVMGTWCGDSKDWVPRFYKVIDKVGFDESKLTLICVDHTKKAPVTELSKLKIQKVPTFIVYKKRREIGRIVETPSDLIEKDILKILTGKDKKK